MVITSATTPCTIRAMAPQSAAAPALSLDSVSLSSGNKKTVMLGCTAAGAALGGWGLNHLTAGLTGAAASVLGGVSGAVALGAVGVLVGGLVAGAGKPGFEGLAAAQAGAIIGGGLGVVGGAIAGAMLGTRAGNVLAIGAGIVAGAAVGLVFGNGLTRN